MTSRPISHQSLLSRFPEIIRVFDAMEKIGSLMEMPSNVTYYEFLVEPLLEFAYNIPQSKMICLIVGPNSQ